MAGKSTMRSEPDSMPRPSGQGNSARKHAADYTPSSDSLSLRIRVSSHLTLPAKATRRFIMQKARRHSSTSSDRL